MIELELRAANATGRYTTVATLRLDADQGVTFTGRRELFDTRAAVIDARTHQRVHFDDDPETWARNLATIYRSGELVPVIVADDDPNPPVERAGPRGLRVPEATAGSVEPQRAGGESTSPRGGAVKLGAAAPTAGSPR